MCLLHVLYAVNGMFMLNEKGALAACWQQRGAYLPDNFQYDMEASLALPDAGGSGECFAKMQRLYDRLREHPATSASCSTPL